MYYLCFACILMPVFVVISACLQRERMVLILVIGTVLFWGSTFALGEYLRHAVWQPADSLRSHNSYVRMYWAGYEKGLAD